MTRGCLRHNALRDANEAEIVRALEAQGFSVTRVSAKGAPDLVVGKGATFQRWVEIKNPQGFNRYTPAQVAWRSRWNGPPPVTLRSIADAEKFMLLACESSGPVLPPDGAK